MTKEIWINLPVKHVEKSREFFTKIGFQLNEQHGNTEHSAAFLVGEKNVALMLFEESMFGGFTKHALSDTSKGSEVLISFDAESREEVDEMAAKAAAAGGNIFAAPEEIQGWMYGCAFADLDGHRWNILFMDRSKMPQG